MSSQYPHRPIPPDQSRTVEVEINDTGSIVIPARIKRLAHLQLQSNRSFIRSVTRLVERFACLLLTILWPSRQIHSHDKS